MSGLLNRLNALIGTKDHKPIKKTKITHKENFQSFEDYKLNHRVHQHKAIKSTENTQIGQIILPNGTGKTREQL